MHLVLPGTCRGHGAQALTVLVDPHGRGRDVCRHIEVGKPQILQGHKGQIRDMLQPSMLLWGQRKTPWLPAGGIARGAQPEAALNVCRRDSLPSSWDPPTSICLSLKTLLMLVLKAEPENIEVMG